MNDILTLKLDNEIVKVEEDNGGRYCLNDIYKSAGKPDTKEVSQFLRSKSDKYQKVSSLSDVCHLEESDKARLRALSENESED